MAHSACEASAAAIVPKDVSLLNRNENSNSNSNSNRYRDRNRDRYMNIKANITDKKRQQRTDIVIKPQRNET